MDKLSEKVKDSSDLVFWFPQSTPQLPPPYPLSGGSRPRDKGGAILENPGADSRNGTKFWEK